MIPLPVCQAQATTSHQPSAAHVLRVLKALLGFKQLPQGVHFALQLALSFLLFDDHLARLLGSPVKQQSLKAGVAWPTILVKFPHIIYIHV